jgi:hypothetical protein
MTNLLGSPCWNQTRALWGIARESPLQGPGITPCVEGRGSFLSVMGCLSDIVVRGARRVSARSRNAGEFRKLSQQGRLVAFSSSWNGIEPLPVDWVGAHSLSAIGSAYVICCPPPNIAVPGCWLVRNTLLFLGWHGKGLLGGLLLLARPFSLGRLVARTPHLLEWRGLLGFLLGALPS